jgi:hypothetical protein
LRLVQLDTPPPRPFTPGPGGWDVEDLRWRLGLSTAQGDGIAADVAALVRANDASSPLAGFAVTRLYASGWSQTGRFWCNFLQRGFHERARAIDGYLVAVTAPPTHVPDDAILVNLLSEAEVVGTLGPPSTAIASSNTPRVRGYEVPGTFHLWHLAATKRDRPRDHTELHNERPWSLLVHALLTNLDTWSRDDIPMPDGALITRDPNAPDGVARDAYGNALGGLRTPWVDVPRAQYLARCSCSPIVGEVREFDDATLRARYDSAAQHDEQWAAAVDAAVEHRWLLADDATALRITPS